MRIIERFPYILYSILAFIPLNEVIESLTKEQRSRWDRLYMLSDKREQYIHPLIWPHPLTGKDVSLHRDSSALELHYVFLL